MDMSLSSNNLTVIVDGEDPQFVELVREGLCDLSNMIDNGFYEVEKNEIAHDNTKFKIINREIDYSDYYGLDYAVSVNGYELSSLHPDEDFHDEDDYSDEEHRVLISESLVPKVRPVVFGCMLQDYDFGKYDRMFVASEPDILYGTEDSWPLDVLNGCPSFFTLSIHFQIGTLQNKYMGDYELDGPNVDFFELSLPSFIRKVDYEDDYIRDDNTIPSQIYFTNFSSDGYKPFCDVPYDRYSYFKSSFFYDIFFQLMLIKRDSNYMIRHLASIFINNLFMSVLKGCICNNNSVRLTSKKGQGLFPFSGVPCHGHIKVLCNGDNVVDAYWLRNFSRIESGESSFSYIKEYYRRKALDTGKIDVSVTDKDDMVDVLSSLPNFGKCKCKTEILEGIY